MKKEWLQINIFGEAERLRDDGIARATDHANNVSPGWTETTYKIFIGEFLPTMKRFTIEQFRTYIKQNKPGYELPPDNRAFGFVPVRAKNAGLIRRLSVSFHRDPKCHHGMSTVWERTY